MQAGDALDQQLRAAIEVFEAGELDRALKMAQQLCRSHGNVAIVHNVHGVIAAEKGAFQVAIDSYKRAIALEPDNCDVHFNLGNVLRDKGDLKPALASYRAALQIKPGDPDVVFNMATVLHGLGELNAAEKLFRQLVELSPKDHNAHSNLGGVLFRLNRTEEAIDCFRRALELRPAFVEAHDNLCEVLEKTNQTDELRKAVAHAITVCRPNDIRIAIRQAQLLRRDDDLEGARKILSGVEKFHPAQAQLNSAYWYLLGDICDRLDDAQTAYKAFVEANIWAAKAVGGHGLEPDRFIRKLDDLQAAYKSVRRPARPEPAASHSDAPQLVFLIGFPRSGTTLLDTVLLSHSRISVIEEKPMVQEMVRLAASWQTGELPNHEDLSGEQVKELRKTYMTRLEQHLPDPAGDGDVVIDKLPLNIVEAGLISKVFPDARFLLVLRHPCDCVLSCFMQDFRLNNAMANFLDLKSTAKCYDKVMSLWTTYTSALHLPVHTVKYEQIVGDLEETVSEVLGFLGLDWEETMADYKATAVERKRIGTPSYHQVVQPIYSRATGRWRRYRAHMVTVLPTLLKWAEIHGYSNDQGNR
jgi:tetratricopeptide (TPR) repeat protein